MLPSFLAFRAHPKHPAGSWSVWKSWQHRVGLSVYFCSVALLVLSAVLQVSDETGYCFCRLFWLQSLWRCWLLCPISAAQQVWMDPKEVPAAPHPLLQLEWLYCCHRETFERVWGFYLCFALVFEALSLWWVWWTAVRYHKKALSGKSLLYHTFEVIIACIGCQGGLCDV